MSSIGSSDYALLAESERTGENLGFLGNLEHLLGGALRSHKHSRSDLDEPREPRDRRAAPTAMTLWDPSSWGAASDGQSPTKGSKGSGSPLTVVAAEDLPGSPEYRSSPVRKAQVKPERPVQDPEAPMLHQVLEQLYTALKAWEASVKASTSLTGAFLPDRDYRQEERAVNVASIAFEDFHAKLGQKSFMQRLGAGLSQEDDQRAMVRAQELLAALRGLSPWDEHRVQELLRLRLEYFLDVKWDPERSRFSCAELFLQLVHDKRRWPEAEILALRWPENLERMLGHAGLEAWLQRAKRWRQSRRANPKRLRPSNEECCGLPNLLEGSSNPSDGYSKPTEVTGCLTFTKIKARNLRSADLLDESDPFVKFELGSLTRAQITSTVWNNEKNPEWKDPRTGVWEVVRMPVTKALRDKFPELQISVFDEDTFSANDPLGSRSVPILNLIEQNAGQRLGSIKKEVTFDTGPLDLMGKGAGDRNPYIEMEITWTPEGVGVLAAPSDPLLLPVEEDTALHLLAEMEEHLPAFLRDFGPNSPENLGFFLQRKDHRLDSALPRASLPSSSGSGEQQVRQYNHVLNRIKEQLLQFRRKHHEPNFAELGGLLEKARDFERSVAGREDLRKAFAFQDEHFPDIGEWSTDRRRQLRNQVFLVKLAHNGSAMGSLDAPPDLRLCFVLLVLLAVIFFMCLDFWALGHVHDKDGRGWMLVLSSLLGFISLMAMFVISFPKWKHYFDKPKSGVNTYQTVPPA